MSLRYFLERLALILNVESQEIALVMRRCRGVALLGRNFFHFAGRWAGR